MENEWGGAERRKGITLEIAEEAARRAAQRVGAIHRRRLVTQTFLAALVVSGAITLIAQFAVVRPSARANARYNCRLLEHVANTVGGFIRTDAVDRRGQLNTQQRAEIIQAFSHLIPARDLEAITAGQQQLDTDTINYWQYVLLAKIKRWAAANCQSTIA